LAEDRYLPPRAQSRRRQRLEIGNTPTLPLRDAQAPGKDVSPTEAEAMLPRHRARDLIILNQ
jgi:hypothetical protein